MLAQFGGVDPRLRLPRPHRPDRRLLFHATWFYSFPSGIGLIYIYFQIPLMVLVFVPALDGLKMQWREATENLGGSTWHYWRLVGGPLLLPAFLGATLLLFANALSAYATIQAWENQIPYVVPQLISTAMTSEVGPGVGEPGPGPGARHDRHGGHRHDRVRAPPAEDEPMAAVDAGGAVAPAIPSELARAGTARTRRGLHGRRRRRLNLFRYIAFTVFVSSSCCRCWRCCGCRWSPPPGEEAGRWRHGQIVSYTVVAPRR